MFVEREAALGAGVPGRDRVLPSQQRGFGTGRGRARAPPNGLCQHRPAGRAAAADAAPRREGKACSSVTVARCLSQTRAVNL